MHGFDRAAEEIDRRMQIRPRIAFLSERKIEGLRESFDEAGSIPLKEVFGASPEDRRTLLFGRVEGVPAVLLEPLSAGGAGDDTSSLLRVLRILGVEVVLLVGSGEMVNPNPSSGVILLLEDHLNLTGWNPLVGTNLEEFGPRFPDMSEAYERGLRTVAEVAAQRVGVALRTGVFAGISRSRWEEMQGMTAADLDHEKELIRKSGADVVGAGLVFETIVARHMGVRVLAFALPVEMDDESAGAHLVPLIREIVKEL